MTGNIKQATDGTPASSGHPPLAKRMGWAFHHGSPHKSSVPARGAILRSKT
jgi:hypothetical protein